MVICIVLAVLDLLFFLAAFRVKKGKVVLFLLASVCFVEITAALAYRAKNGYLIYNQRTNNNSDLFEYSPYYVGKLKANIDTTIAGKHVRHNLMGWRGDDVVKKPFTIVCIGGSTTYGVGVSNHETWPSLLQQKFADSVAVINLGVPGHATTEHLSTLLYDVPLIKPQMMLFHIGLNDMRLSYLEALSNDYHEHHAPALFQSMGLDVHAQLPKIASLHLLADMAIAFGLAPTPFLPERIKAADVTKTTARLKKQYALHVTQLIALAKLHTDNIVFVPQILIPDAFHNQQYEWWAPFIPDKELVPLMQAFNAITKEVALANNCQFIDAVATIPFTLNHFNDPSHLNANGLTWFTDSLASHLLAD